MTSPTIISDPFRAGSGNGASRGDQPKSDKVELETSELETPRLETPRLETTTHSTLGGADVSHEQTPRRHRRVMLLQVRNQDEALEHELECVRQSTDLDAQQLHAYNVVRQPAIGWHQLEGVDALVIGGSGDHSAVRDYAFTPWLEELILQAAAVGTPIFGICWGHHFLARAFGGTVVTEPRHEEIGTFDIELTAAGRDDDLFHAMSPVFAANLVHHDCVDTMPPGFIELAVSEACRYQTIRCPDRPLVGTQFHGEMDKAQLSYRLGLYQDEYLHDIRQARAVIDGLRPTPEAGKVLRRFLEIYT